MLTSAILRCIISCSIPISPTSSPRPRTTAASLAYFDSYRSARLPSNLLQAQRDFFGAHTYERIDKPGVFHTEWIESDHKPVQKKAEPKPHDPHQGGE